MRVYHQASDDDVQCDFYIKFILDKTNYALIAEDSGIGMVKNKGITTIVSSWSRCAHVVLIFKSKLPSWAPS